MIIIIVFSKNSFGKYIKKFFLENENSISRAIVLIENDPIIYISSIENKTYYFKIKNYDNDEINEVDIEYCIKILSNSTTTMKIFKNDQEMKIVNNETEKNLLNKNIKQEDIFKIEIDFLNESNQEIIDQIKLEIYYEQKNI